MLISIGILAYNEENVIERTLSSLFAQTVFLNPLNDDDDVSWEVIVVPNGCSDDTSNKASQALEHLTASKALGNVTWSVREIAEAGKSNAWNRFVHDFSSPKAELIVMIDADIEFGDPGTISNCISTLLADTHAVVAVDLPLKDVVKKTRKTLIEKFSLLVSRMKLSGPVPIAGSFYCAYASSMREVYMPPGLLGEDGFLRAMLVTNCFRESVDDKKVIRAKNASHYYETLTTLKGIFQHELRLKIGTAQNCYLCWDLLHLATDPNGTGAGVTIRNRIAHDPNWYHRVIDNAIRNHGWWVLPRGMLLGRFSNMKFKSDIKEKLKTLLVSLAAFPFDLVVLLTANRKLKQSTMIGYW